METSPLTRGHRNDPRLAERWDLVAFGTELGTAYSELVDPVDQRNRLTEQSLRAADGDPEAMQVDEAFLTALEYAMPPTGGLGLGVDRLVMMLLGASIRLTLAFPFVRPGGRCAAPAVPPEHPAGDREHQHREHDGTELGPRSDRSQQRWHGYGSLSPACPPGPGVPERGDDDGPRS